MRKRLISGWQANWPRVKRRLQWTWGGLTYRRRRLPDFLIIGTAKGGTTSLYHYLRNHPDLYLPAIKEVHYYDLNYGRGDRWYRKFFNRQDDHRLAGEATPYYLFHPWVPERVYRDNPRVKLIVLLRDPVERAYSHYCMNRRIGLEPLADFAEAVRAEGARMRLGARKLRDAPTRRSPQHQHFSYLSRGKYAPQLRRWLRFFPPEQLLVLSSERFLTDTEAVAGEVCRFLNVRTIPLPDRSLHNEGRYEPLPPEQEEALNAYFAPYQHQLEALLNRYPAWRKTCQNVPC